MKPSRACPLLAALLLGALLVVGPAAPRAEAYTNPAWNETSPTSRTDSRPSGTQRVIEGDVTGDGVPDQLAITSNKEFFVGVYTAPGTSNAITWTKWLGSFGSSISTSPLVNNSFLGDGDPYRVVNGDTHVVVRADLTIIVPANESGSGQTEYWFYHSNGTGFETVQKSFPGVYLGDRVLTGDFNGDRRMDFLHIFQSTLTWKVTLSVMTGTGGQEYATATTWLTGVGQGHFDEVGDFNGDGAQDVLQIYSTSWRVALGSHNAFTYQEWRTGITQPDGINIGDVSGDGYDDAVIQYNSPKANPPIWYTFISRHATIGPWFDTYSHQVGLGTESFRLAGDYNADGKADIAVVTPAGTPVIVFGEYNQSTNTPSLTKVTSSVSIGTVSSVFRTYHDLNDSHDLYLKTSTGNYFLTANNANFSTSRVVHLNNPFQLSAPPSSCDGVSWCPYFTSRDPFIMPNRIPFYVKTVDFTRDYRGYTGFSIADECFYVYPKRYTVGSTDDGPHSKNREEACSNQQKGVNDPGNDAVPVTYPGNGLIVPQGADVPPEAEDRRTTTHSRIEVHASWFNKQTPVNPRPILRTRLVINKAALNPSTLTWVLRLPESDEGFEVPGYTTGYPLPVVRYNEPAPANHTEWGQTDSDCTQKITGVAFYNSFNGNLYQAEAQLQIYVSRAGGGEDTVNFTPIEYKGVEGSSDGSYTSRGPVYFSTPITVNHGDIIGVRTWHSNYGPDPVKVDTGYYLLMEKGSDSTCSP